MMMKGFTKFFFIAPVFVTSFLIRPNDVYIRIIQDLYEHYQTRGLVLLYSHSNKEQLQNAVIMARLSQLQLHFNKLMILTTVTDIRSFASQDSDYFINSTQLLYVILNDFDDVRSELSAFLAPLVDMSRHKWLIFMANKSQTDDFFTDIYIPFNCDFLVCQLSKENVNVNSESTEIISEVYKVTQEGKLITRRVATWNPNNSNKLLLPAPHLNHLRNFEEHPLRITIYQSPELEITRDKNNRITLGGGAGSLMNILREKLHFTEIFTEVSEYGRANETHTTGGLKTLISKESDIFPVIIFMLRKRMDYIGFTLPLVMPDIRMYVKDIPPVINWHKFTNPFDKHLWAMYGIQLFIFAGIISTVLLIEKIQLGPIFYKKNKPPTFEDNIFAIWCALAGRCADLQGHISTPIRIIYFTLHTTALVVMAAYSAILISSLTTRNVYEEKFDLQALLDDGGYRISELRHSGAELVFRPADPKQDARFRKILIPTDKNPLSYSEGLRQVCNDENFAFISSARIARQFYQPNCYLFEVHELPKAIVSFALQRYSPYREHFNLWLLAMRERAIINRVLNQNMDNEREFRPPEMPAIDIRDIISILVTYSALMFFSFIILGIEKIVYHYMLQRKILSIVVKTQHDNH